MTGSYKSLLIGDETPAPHPGSNASPPLPGAEEIHLFVRGYESIRILIGRATKTVQVFGPGRVQKVHEYSTAAELQELLHSYEQSVLAGGWILLDVNDRRIPNRS